MPTYTIQTPNRRTVRVQAPDFASAMRTAASEETGYLTTEARAIPFLTEAGAGWSAGVRSLDDLISGRKPDFAGYWNRARAEQQAVVDSFRREHPFYSNNATAVGTVGPMLAAGLGLPGAARSAAPLLSSVNAEAAGAGAAQIRGAKTVLRNAFTGAGAGAVYGAARPGDLQQRTQNAASSLIPGAAWGAGLPLGVGAGAALARDVREMAPGAGAVGSELADTLHRAATRFGLEAAARLAGNIGKVAPEAGAMGSELADTLRRAAARRTAVDQSRQISLAAGARGEADAIRLLRQMGVSPDALEQAQSLARGKPITTAEAIGPAGIELAQGLRGRAGTTDVIANGVLGQRAASRPDRLLSDASQVAEAHPLSVLGDLDQLLADSRKNGESYMEEARNLAPPFSTRLKQLFEAPESQEHWPTVMKILSAQGRDPVDLGYKVGEDGQTQSWMVPSLDFLDTLKDQLQGTLEGQTGPLNEKQQAIRKIADGLQASLTSPVPSGMAYADAYKFRGDPSSTEAAWRDAQGRLFDSAVDPATFDAEFYKLLPFQKDAATAAGAGDIANLAFQQPFNADAVSDPAVFEKMRSLFATPGAKRLTDSLRTEGAMANFEQPPQSGLAGLNLRLRAAGQAPLNMAGRNSLGGLLYQDPSATAQTMRNYGDAPNAFDTMRLRLPPPFQYRAAGLLGALQAPGVAPSTSQP